NPGSGNPGSGNPGSGNPGSGNPGSGNPGSGNPGDGTTPPEGETPDPGPSIPELPEPLPEPDPEPPGLDDPNDVMACQGNMRLPQCQCLNRFCRWFPASSSSCPWNQQTPNIPANCRN
ncbi:MAG: pentapeptide repeat-containing protein, partial [Wenzhouxiangella sp.]